MDYERIHKVQSGVISPSKLRMKLMGAHHSSSRKKEGSSNCSSSRTSPCRVADTEFVKSSLLDSNDDDDHPDFADEVEAPSSGVTSTTVTSEAALDPDTSRHHPLKENNTHDLDHAKIHQLLRSESVNSNAVHNVRAMEDENPGYDSSSSFEFHKERSAAQSQLVRSLSRPMSSKWNDAEKWIMNKQNVQQHGGGYPRKNGFHNNQGSNRMPITTHMGRVAPELVATGGGRMVDTKRVDFCQTASQLGLEKFSFLGAPGTPSISGQANTLMEQYGQSKDLKEVDPMALSTMNTSTEDRTVVPVIRSVCMRDMGTEMTPIASQEPSRTSTPIGATTPIRSPTSSIPSTPRRGGPTTTPVEHEDGSSNKCTASQNGTKRELSEEELKLKTRREIVALGVKLGKMNIAAWASTEEEEKNMAQSRDMESVEQIEFEKRAAAWEEAEKCKHSARYKREEIQIQAWESQQIAKLEADMRRTESKVEQMKAQAEAKMVKKVAMARQRAEERRAAAESRKNRDAERTAAKAEYIRQTGRMPSTHYICCGWL
ncbi:unnamed protein product [Linum tenue]|uniref:Remorin C-terminal domain-containing protein n=2 Tax=Linum tenue TaxID=586396 RepID=A0AAV0QLD2_9ROSI|nr:unnamed protein product [Linum tenue]